MRLQENPVAHGMVKISKGIWVSDPDGMVVIYVKTGITPFELRGHKERWPYPPWRGYLVYRQELEAMVGNLRKAGYEVDTGSMIEGCVRL